MKKIFFTLFLLLGFCTLQAQSAIEDWGDHLPYNAAYKVAIAGDRVYASTLYSLFYYDKSDNSIRRLSKITGLSDFGISDIQFHEELNTLVIAYENANIDLIKEGEIINISDIKRDEGTQNKSINRVFLKDNFAYLSCSFGIVVLDIDREEIHDTYHIGPNGDDINVLDFSYNPQNNSLYAGTETGLYYALADSPNLANFEFWQKDTTLPIYNGIYDQVEENNGLVYINLNLEDSDTLYVNQNNNWEKMPFLVQINDFKNKKFIRSSNGNLIVGKYFGDISVYPSPTERSYGLSQYRPEENFINTSVFPNDAQYDTDGSIWIADNNNALVKNVNSETSEMILPNGPNSNNAFSITSNGPNVYAVPGGIHNWGPVYLPAEIYTFNGVSWYNIDKNSNAELGSMNAFASVSVDPNNKNKIYVGSMKFGMVEFENGSLNNIYNSANSSLQDYVGQVNDVRIPSMTFDDQGNLWLANSGAEDILSVKKANGEWKSFNLGSGASNIEVTQLIIDKSGYKWLALRGNKIAVFNDNGTIDNVADDEVKLLTSSAGNGNIPGNFVFALAADIDGEIWIGGEGSGADYGVRVIYSPENIFRGGNYDAEQILVLQDGHYGLLLKTESLQTIAINGANQKWFGTKNAGAFLMSEDGTEQIYHFTTENSPLFDNNVLDITIDDNGNVFFATARGIVSFKDRAVPPKPNYDSLYVYPNPVRETYDGLIAIRGLIRNSDVRITDISGNLVFATKSEGGQAIWNARNFEGNRVKTGVYLIFISNEDGSITTTSKIAVIH